MGSWKAEVVYWAVLGTWATSAPNVFVARLSPAECHEKRFMVKRKNRQEYQIYVKAGLKSPSTRSWVFRKRRQRRTRAWRGLELEGTTCDTLVAGESFRDRGKREGVSFLLLLLHPVQMASPLAVIDTIFNRPRHAAAILFLIEDSCDMAPLWQRLGDTYIPYLLNAIKNANPSAAVSLFAPALPLSPIVTLQAEALWMTASEHAPFKRAFGPSARQTPQWDGIPTINFSPHGGNMVSPVNVTRAVEVRRARFCHLLSDT